LAQFTQALFFQQGQGIENDEVMTCHWYGKAATGEIPATKQQPEPEKN